MKSETLQSHFSRPRQRPCGRAGAATDSGHRSIVGVQDSQAGCLKAPHSGPVVPGSAEPAPSLPLQSCFHRFEQQHHQRRSSHPSDLPVTPTVTHGRADPEDRAGGAADLPHPHQLKVSFICRVEAAALPSSKARLPETKRPRHIRQIRTKGRSNGENRENQTKMPEQSRAERSKAARQPAGPGAAGGGRGHQSAAALRNQIHEPTRKSGTSSRATLRAGHGEERHPTWLEHTLEIKDDQDKGSQTGGENHPADPAHPHQVAQSLLHGRALLAGSGRGCAAGLSGALEVPRWTDGPGRQPSSSTAERTTAGTRGGGEEPGRHHPRPHPLLLEEMSAPTCTPVSRSITEEGKITPVGKDYWDFSNTDERETRVKSNNGPNAGFCIMAGRVQGL